MTRWLRRQGHEVAFSTLDRVMRELGLFGVTRGAHITEDFVEIVADFSSRAPIPVRAMTSGHVALTHGHAVVREVRFYRCHREDATGIQLPFAPYEA